MSDLSVESQFISAITDIFNEKIPFNKVLGLKVDSIKNNRPYIKIGMRDELVGNYIRNTLHGGVISSVIDVTGGLAAFLSVHEQMAEKSLEEKIEKFSRLGTIDLRIDYLRPGYGEWYISTGYTLRTGRRVAVTRIELSDNNQQLIAVGTGSYIIA